MTKIDLFPSDKIQFEHWFTYKQHKRYINNKTLGLVKELEMT